MKPTTKPGACAAARACSRHQDLANGHHGNPTGRKGYFTEAFFHRPEELRDEIVQAGFKGANILPVEGPCWLAKDLEAVWQDEAVRAELVELAQRVEGERELMGTSLHVVGVGAKRDG